METISGKLTGWDAWSTHEADHARDRYAAHQLRLSASAPGSTANNSGLISGDEIDQPTLGEVTTSLMVDKEQSRKKSIVQAALARAQAAKALAKKDGS